VVFRQEVVHSDPEAVHAACQRIGLRAAVGSDDPRFSYRLVQAGDEQLTIARASLHGSLSFWGGTEVFAVTEAQGTRYDWHYAEETGTGAATGAPVLFRPGHQGLVMAEEIRSTTVYLPMGLVQATADTVYGTSTPATFASSVPASPQPGQAWSALARYGAEVISGEAFDQPLVRTQLARHLTVGLLECFQLIGDREQRYLSIEAQARRYRAAVQFFEDFASLPITVEDAARATQTTTKALVQAFRANHPLGLGPAQYLRRTRLAAAHHDLVGADPTAGDTVQDIAARWGFPHPGRFAAAYRTVYGVTPRYTLHR
jgi:AraC-like DNA-binding protein